MDSTTKKRRSTTMTEFANLLQEKELLGAFCNLLVFAMAICWVLGAIAFYCLFRDFAKPMLWAVISGITVYPLKRKLKSWLRLWLDDLLTSGTPLSLGLVMIPWKVCNNLGNVYLKSMRNNLRLVVIIAITFPAISLLLQLETLPRSLLAMVKIFKLIDNVLRLCSSLWIPFVVAIYVLTVLLLKLSGSAWSNVLLKRAVTGTMWTILLTHACAYVGPLRTPIFVSICLVSFGSCVLHVIATTIGLSKEKVTSENKEAEANGSATPGDQPKTEEAEDEADKYIQGLFLLCAVVWISQHLSLTPLLLIPLLCSVLSNLNEMFRVRDALRSTWEVVSTRCLDFKDLFIPPFLTHLANILKQLDRWVCSGFALLVGVGHVFFFQVSADTSQLAGSRRQHFGHSDSYSVRPGLNHVPYHTGKRKTNPELPSLQLLYFVQLYYESVNVVNIATEIGNRAITYNPRLQQWLKETCKADTVAEAMESIVKKGYTFGRVWLSNQVLEMVQGDEQKAKILEEQLLTTVDNYFYTFLSNESSKATTGGQNATVLWDPLSAWKSLWSVVTMESFDDGKFLENLKEQLTILWMVLESTWQVFMSNLEVIAFGLSHVMSTVLASGTATVFLTFLLYLLNNSDEEFKPLRLLREMLPISQDTSSQITGEVEEAVKSVFLVTLKMAFFYGMFTWLTHTLFAVSLVFIPSVCAAILAAVPFFGTYLVAIPAALELYLLNGEPLLAVFLFAIHYGCSYVVDDAIYAGIKITTPFVTGMAVAGGLLWWGLEGAIFGPLVLCCLLVLVSTYKILIASRRDQAASP
ncbi:Transmembrane protein C9orf5 [Trichuris trichiura]|uniref:Transmembrane protein C9orf5 n=1 Tax=Trichuris trichiura TaxID=36087 RepID=A0A077YWT4_TRITR|nr:Transmembrane protein C9orf5 [Trichuris trichiura]